MTAIVPAVAAAHKDEDRPESVLPPQGSGLLVEILRGRDQGCSTWRLPDNVVAVPRLERLVPRSLPVRADVALALLTHDAPADLSTHAQAQMRYLKAAAYRDLLGYDDEQIAAVFGFEASGRRARSAVSRGRRLWAGLGAWPWSCLPPGAQPAQHWGSERLLREWRLWRAGSAV